MNNAHRSEEQVRRLAALIITAHDTQECQICLDSLEAYVEAQQTGEDYMVQMQDVARHLDRCVSCAEAYALVYETRLHEDQLSLAEQVPEPDLSFLRQANGGPVTPQQLRGRHTIDRLRETLDQAVSRTGALLRVTFSQPLLDALSAARPQTGPALAMRSAGEEVDPLVDLELHEPQSELERLQLTVYPLHATPERCTIRVKIGVRGLDWPDLAGAAVRLMLPDQTLHATTDAWGETVVSDVLVAGLPTLQVEVDATTLAH